MEYANKLGWSDVTPFEVIERKNEKLLVIREMTCDNVKVPSHTPGGFSAHFENQEQEWNVTPDRNGRIEKIRLHKDGKWRDKHGNNYDVSDRAIKFHDYNF